MRLSRIHTLAMVALALPLAISAQTVFQAELTAHAFLPAQTFIAAPKDAPDNLQTSGKFTTGKRVEKIGSVEGLSADRPTGVFYHSKVNPFKDIPALKKCQMEAFGC